MATAKKKTATKKTAKKSTAAKTTSKATASKKPVKKPAAQKPAAPKKAAAVKKPAAPKTASSSADPLGLGIAPYKEKKGEEYMGEPQQAHFSALLNAWRDSLMQEVDRTVHHMQDDAGHFPDPNDRASQESEFSLELRTRDRERKLIRKIDESLNNIKSGDYGYCESCGVEIGIRRLEARPTANLCIDCKVLDELREKQGR